MLVPNPTTDAKVLIGDREAEDTSDLSDAASDYGDTESVPSINNILVESKTIIGGHNLLSFDSPDSDTADRQSSDDTSLSNEGGEMEENEVTLLDSAAGVDDSSSKNKGKQIKCLYNSRNVVAQLAVLFQSKKIACLSPSIATSKKILNTQKSTLHCLEQFSRFQLHGQGKTSAI